MVPKQLSPQRPETFAEMTVSQPQFGPCCVAFKQTAFGVVIGPTISLRLGLISPAHQAASHQPIKRREHYRHITTAWGVPGVWGFITGVCLTARSRFPNPAVSPSVGHLASRLAAQIVRESRAPAESRPRSGEFSRRRQETSGLVRKV